MTNLFTRSDSVWNKRTFRLGLPLLLLAFFALQCIFSMGDQSATYDEGVHITGGYSYWKTGDYRLHPESGQLIQRWVSIPLLFFQPTFPEQQGRLWELSEQWLIARDFLYRSGNNPEQILWWSRLMVILLGIGLGMLIFRWSHRLFGYSGAIVSLFFYSLSPTIRAHSQLATADLAMSLFLAASVYVLWKTLHRVSIGRVLGGGFLLSALALTKVSGVLILPILFVMAAIRLTRAKPLTLDLPTRLLNIHGRLKIGAILLGTWMVQAAIVVLLIWASYGFRFIPFKEYRAHHDQMRLTWNQIEDQQGALIDFVVFARDHRLLPEAYLIGYACIGRFMGRHAFMSGNYSTRGQRWFFPFSFLVKTTSALLAGLALAMGLAASRAFRPSAPRKRRGLHRLIPGLYRSAPLWIMITIIALAAILSSLNIGHRHILAIYVPLFILLGHTGRLMHTPFLAGRIALCAIVLGQASAAFWIHPHYLAFFNLPSGGPSMGYRRLVDSSLDWGQDLPGLKRWLDQNSEKMGGQEPVYLAYFGTASLRYYGINGIQIARFPEDRAEPHVLPLQPGLYAISATLLQSVRLKAFGAWCSSYEQDYQTSRKVVEQIAKAHTDGLRDKTNQKSRLDDLWLYDQMRFGRLCKYLLKREPDAHVGYSILLYRLNKDEIDAALNGPPVELFPSNQVRR